MVLLLPPHEQERPTTALTTIVACPGNHLGNQTAAVASSAIAPRAKKKAKSLMHLQSIPKKREKFRQEAFATIFEEDEVLRDFRDHDNNVGVLLLLVHREAIRGRRLLR